MEHDKEHRFDCNQCRGIGNFNRHEYHKDRDQYHLGCGQYKDIYRAECHQDGGNYGIQCCENGSGYGMEWNQNRNQHGR